MSSRRARTEKERGRESEIQSERALHTRRILPAFFARATAKPLSSGGEAGGRGRVRVRDCVDRSYYLECGSGGKS